MACLDTAADSLVERQADPADQENPGCGRTGAGVMIENDKGAYNAELLRQYARRNRNNETFRNWLKVNQAQQLDILVRDRAWDIMAEIKRSI